MISLRPFAWSDVQIAPIGYFDINGKQRVQASIRGCSFINKTMWLTDWKETPTQKAVLLLELTRAANRILERLNLYEKL